MPKRLTIQIPKDLHREFKRIALDKDKTMTDLIAEFMRETIKAESEGERRT